MVATGVDASAWAALAAGLSISGDDGKTIADFSALFGEVLRAHEVRTAMGAIVIAAAAIRHAAMQMTRLAGTLYLMGISCKYVPHMRVQVK